MTAAPAFAAWFWSGTAPAAGAAVGRDPRVDVFRGLSLIIIIVDHVAGTWLSSRRCSAAST